MSHATTPSFPPPPPARKSRAGGIMLLLAGVLAVGSAWMPLLQANGQAVKLFDFFDSAEYAQGQSLIDDPKTWFFAVVGGGAVAVLFGLIGLTGGSGANVTAGTLGLLAAVAIAYPPIYMLSGTDVLDNSSDLLQVLGAGYYMAAAAALIALIGTLFAFIGATKR